MWTDIRGRADGSVRLSDRMRTNTSANRQKLENKEPPSSPMETVDNVEKETFQELFSRPDDAECVTPR